MSQESDMLFKQVIASDEKVALATRYALLAERGLETAAITSTSYKDLLTLLRYLAEFAAIVGMGFNIEVVGNTRTHPNEPTLMR